jgi:hypothetical protein
LLELDGSKDAPLSLKNCKSTFARPLSLLTGGIFFTWHDTDIQEKQTRRLVNRISVIFVYVRVLINADDMKLFLPVRGFQHCMKIQADLNKRSEWCERTSLFLNIDKCKTITFSRTRYPVEFAYMLAGTVLDWVGSLNDRVSSLGVIMDEQINFSEHVDVMVGKVFAMLGFIRRLSFEFNDPYTLKSLYTSLVYPKLK